MRAGSEVEATLRVAAAFWMGLMCVATAAAQVNPTAPSQSPVIRVTSQFVVVDAEVVNKKTGDPVQGLRARDFVRAEDRSPQRISYFSQDELPLSVVFLFDLTDTVRPVHDNRLLPSRQRA